MEKKSKEVSVPMFWKRESEPLDPEEKNPGHSPCTGTHSYGRSGQLHESGKRIPNWSVTSLYGQV